MSVQGIGSQNANTALSFINELDFFVDGKILEINTIKICQVTKVNGDTVNVKPLVLNLDGDKKPIEATELKELPFIRQQGGTSGFVIEYNVGDIVLVGFCDRDPQGVIRSKKETAPATYCPFPLSGGIVLGAVLFAAAQVYLKTTDKVYCVGSFDVSLDANIQGDLTVGGNSTITGNNTVNGNNVVVGNNEAATYSVGGTPGATLSFTDLAGVKHSVVNGIIIS
jgi:hypothetical protein